MISSITELFVGQYGLKSKFPCKYLQKSPISNGALILIHTQAAELMGRWVEMTDKHVKESTKCQISCVMRRRNECYPCVRLCKK